jgi:hypothetical protein
MPPPEQASAKNQRLIQPQYEIYLDMKLNPASKILLEDKLALP